MRIAVALSDLRNRFSGPYYGMRVFIGADGNSIYEKPKKANSRSMSDTNNYKWFVVLTVRGYGLSKHETINQDLYLIELLQCTVQASEASEFLVKITANGEII